MSSGAAAGGHEAALPPPSPRLLLPAAAAQDAADPCPSGTPRAGRYVSNAVGPTIDFRVGEGWVAGPSGDGPIFTLERTDPPGTVLTVTRFDGETFLDSCDPSSMTVVEPSVERLAEIIAGNPYLNPGPPRAIEVDGYRGLQLDVGVPAYTECQLPFLLIWALPIGEGGEFVQVADQQSRFIILDVEGDVIVVAIESFPGVPFGGLLEASHGARRVDAHRTRRVHPAASRRRRPRAEALPAASPGARASVSPSPGAAADEGQSQPRRPSGRPRVGAARCMHG